MRCSIKKRNGKEYIFEIYGIPYGISDHNPIQGSEKTNQPNIQVEQIQPPIQDTRLQPNTLPEEFRNQIQNQAPQNLPSRDIPMNTQNYQIDAVYDALKYNLVQYKIDRNSKIFQRQYDVQFP